MAMQADNELENFHRFVTEQLKNGPATLTPEQVLANWREQLDTVASIQRGLDDIDAEQTQPSSDVLADLRDELNT